MKRGFEARLRCPRCRAAALALAEVAEETAQEVRAGTLACSACGHTAPIAGGIADLLFDPPEFVRREADGLGRFAEVMRNDGWSREDLMKLPYVESGYWYAQAVLMQQTLDTVEFAPGATVLDVGSNTCWAAATFAQAGLEPTALDISTQLMQGLATADWHFEDKDVYFERVLGVMFDLPFADASFDYVWACEVLHHNHRANLAATYRELYRVLKPGGQLIVANEPLRTLMTPKIDPGHEVAEFEGHEHAYMRHSYTLLARRAGFSIDVRGPRYHDTFQPGHSITLSERMRVDQYYRAATVMASRRSRHLRQALLALRAYVFGGTALHMICTKPPV